MIMQFSMNLNDCIWMLAKTGSYVELHLALMFYWCMAAIVRVPYN